MKKIALFLMGILSVAIGLCTFAGCSQENKLEGRYVFQSYTVFETVWAQESGNTFKKKRGEEVARYEIGDGGVIKGLLSHTFSKDSYILDVSADGSYSISGKAFNSFTITDWKYDYYWTGDKGSLFLDEKERSLMLFKRRNSTNTEDETQLFRGYREKDEIVLIEENWYPDRAIEIRLQKVQMNQEEKKVQSVVGKYTFLKAETTVGGEVVRVAAGALKPDGAGEVYKDTILVVVLFADGRAIVHADNFGYQLSLGQLGTWIAVDSKVVLQGCSHLQSALNLKQEPSFEISEHTLTLYTEGEVWDADWENAEVSVVLKKKKVAPTV